MTKQWLGIAVLVAILVVTTATAWGMAPCQVGASLCDACKGKWVLWTSGTQLRGANIYQRRVYPELDGSEFLGSGSLGPPYTQEDLDRLAAWGANYVNISHPGLFTEEPPYVLDPDVQVNLDRLLRMVAHARRAGSSPATTTTASGAIRRPRTPGWRCGATPPSGIKTILWSLAMI